MLITMRHKQRCLDKLAAEKAEAAAVAILDSDLPLPTKSENFNYQTALISLQAHREQLKALPDVRDKVELKRKLVPQYLGFLQTYLESGAYYQNEVLAELIVWLIDIDNLEEAMTYAELAIEQQQLSPPQFNRDLPSLVAELIHDWAERQYKQNASAHPYFDRVVELIASEQWLMSNVIIPNKIFKLAALFAERDSNWPKAVHFYEQCVAVNPDKHGVKTRLELAKKQLEKTLSKTPPRGEQAAQS